MMTSSINKIVYYQELICILLIGDVIIGPWGYKYGSYSYPHNNHPKQTLDWSVETLDHEQ